MAVQPWFRYQHFGRSIGQALVKTGQLTEQRRTNRRGIPNPGWTLVFAEHIAENIGPFACRNSGPGACNCRAHDVLGAVRHSPQLGHCRVDCLTIASRPPRLHVGHELSPNLRVNAQDRLGSTQRRRFCFPEVISTNDGDFSGLDRAHPAGIRLNQCTLHVFDRGERSPAIDDPIQLGPRLVHQLSCQPFDHVGPGEDVVVLE